MNPATPVTSIFKTELLFDMALQIIAYFQAQATAGKIPTNCEFSKLVITIHFFKFLIEYANLIIIVRDFPHDP
jgi:hypothetical protein